MLIHSPAFTAFFLHQMSTEKKRKEKKKKIALASFPFPPVGSEHGQQISQPISID